MKVGDLVVRAYAHEGIVPGIIVGEYTENVTNSEVAESPEVLSSYIEYRMYIIQWSDGLQTHEMYEELDLYEQSIAESYG